jgi:hypothetical protein
LDLSIRFLNISRIQFEFSNFLCIYHFQIIKLTIHLKLIKPLKNPITFINLPFLFINQIKPTVHIIPWSTKKFKISFLFEFLSSKSLSYFFFLQMILQNDPLNDSMIFSLNSTFIHLQTLFNKMNKKFKILIHFQLLKHLIGLKKRKILNKIFISFLNSFRINSNTNFQTKLVN